MNSESFLDIQTALKANGLKITKNQLTRWRRAGLLPQVVQTPRVYRGSTVHYPKGTAKQAVEIMRLLLIKRDFDLVGWELWWRGYRVDQKHWKPKLEMMATTGDRLLDLLRRAMDREDRHERDTTLFDRIAKTKRSNGTFSRIRNRLSDDELASVFRVILEAGCSRFDGFEPSIDGQRTHDERALVRALDTAVRTG